MINYLKSENYRLLNKKNLYITSLICISLIATAAFVLYYFQQTDSTFPYGTSKFFYSNAISGGLMIIIIGLIFNLALTGNDTSLMKQSISFGISRNVIFWSKLILTLSYFLLFCIIAIIFMIALGENILPSHSDAVKNVLIASVNMIPIVLSGFSLIHTMKMLKIGEVYIFITVLFIYVLSGNLLRVLFRPIAGLNELYKYSPNTVLNENLMMYLDDSAQLGFEYWVIGITISGIALLIGAKGFAKRVID